MKQLVYFSGKIKELDKFLKILSTITGKIIAFDIDNTLINVNKELQRLGYDISSYPNPALTEDFWVHEEGINILFSADLIPTTTKFVATFSMLNAEIVFVTSRSPRLKTFTENWVKKYFPGFEVYFTKEKYQLDADIYVEDDPRQIQKLISLNKTILVPEWPYNQNLFKGLKNVIYYKV